MSGTGRRPAGRGSIRLPGKDYSTGAFFITLIKSDDAPLFGTIADGIMYPSAIGMVILEELQRSAEIRAEVTLDAFVLTPDHLHAILFFHPDVPTLPAMNRRGGRGGSGPAPRSLGSFIAGFKSAITSRVLREGSAHCSLWQRGYNDRVIHDERGLENARRYIRENPIKWSQRHG